MFVLGGLICPDLAVWQSRDIFGYKTSHWHQYSHHQCGIDVALTIDRQHHVFQRYYLPLKMDIGRYVCNSAVFLIRYLPVQCFFI